MQRKDIILIKYFWECNWLTNKHRQQDTILITVFIINYEKFTWCFFTISLPYNIFSENYLDLNVRKTAQLLVSIWSVLVIGMICPSFNSRLDFKVNFPFRSQYCLHPRNAISCVFFDDPTKEMQCNNVFIIIQK